MNLLTMKFTNGRPSRKFKAPAKTALVRTRPPTDEERALGAEIVFVRMDLELNRYFILVGHGNDGPSQFGAPMWVMNENGSDAAAWHREWRAARKRGVYMGTRPAMSRHIRTTRRGLG
jgi:hypothetical protein